MVSGWNERGYVLQINDKLSPSVGMIPRSDFAVMSLNKSACNGEAKSGAACG